MKSKLCLQTIYFFKLLVFDIQNSRLNFVHLFMVAIITTI